MNKYLFKVLLIKDKFLLLEMPLNRMVTIIHIGHKKSIQFLICGKVF